MNIIGYEFQTEGKEFALYTINISTTLENIKNEWIIKRRYSEFFNLHQSIKKYGIANFELPGKSFLKIKRDDFLDVRKQDLDRYLKTVIQNQQVVKSREFRVFIFSSDLKKSLDYIDDDQSPKGFFKNLIDIAHIDEVETWFNKLRSSQTDKQFRKEDVSIESSTSIIADLFQEIFELRERNNWLRRNTVVLLIQQFFGGTVDRKVTENLKWVFGDENVAFYLNYFKESFWPDDKWNDTVTIRTATQIQDSRTELQYKLQLILPGLFGGVVGRNNARKGAERVFMVFQNKRINQSLVYTVLDVLIQELSIE